MRKGDRVRWSEAHCRLEALMAKPVQALAVYESLREQLGKLVGMRTIAGHALVDVVWDSAWSVHGPCVHTLPAELLELAVPLCARESN